MASSSDYGWSGPIYMDAMTVHSGRAYGPSTPGEDQPTSGLGDFSKILEQIRELGRETRIDGGAGNDTIDAMGIDVYVNGGTGNDNISVMAFNADIKGGEGDDVIRTQSPYFNFFQAPLFYGPGNIFGNQGHDQIHARSLTNVHGGEGNDVINGHGGLVNVTGGSGDDTINTGGGSARVFGEAGDDVISTGQYSYNVNGKLYGGAGDDTLNVSGRNMRVMGGTGNDTFNLDGLANGNGVYAPVNGGLGNDTLNFLNSFAQVEYFSGDGHDTMEGANELTTVKLGPGLDFENTTFAIEGDDLVMSFANDDGSITFKNYNTSGLPVVEFTGGRQLDASSTIAYAGGDPDAYQGSDGIANSTPAAKSSD